MSQTKPTLVPLRDMTAGQSGDFFAFLVDKTRGTTREGKAYYLCRFRDQHRTAALMVWADGTMFADCETNWKVGEFYKIRGRFEVHDRYGPQIEAKQVRPAREGEEGFDRFDLIERSRRDSAAMFAELRELVIAEVSDEPLRDLVLVLLDENAERWQQLPASKDRYYPFAGGLLEHSLQVTHICLDLVNRYGSYYTELQPPLNRDLVVAGAVLHDLGRILEFDDNLLSPGISVPGRLTGHLLLGRDLLRDRARQQGNLNPELLQLLEHVLTTHLALPEWGSPRLPLIPEVLILHHAYDLDAKLEMYVRCLSRDESEGPFTERDPGLNRALLKRRMV